LYLRRGGGYQNVSEEFGFVEIKKKKFVGTVCENVYIYIYLRGDCCEHGNELSNTIKWQGIS